MRRVPSTVAILALVVAAAVAVTLSLLVGSEIGAFCGALVSILLLYHSRNWNEVIAWLMGNLERPDPWYRVRIVGPCLLISGVAMAVYARDLNLLLLGEVSAAQLGVEA